VKKKAWLSTGLAAVTAIGGCAKIFFEKHTIEFHLEPNRPRISRVWDENEPMPRDHAIGITEEGIE
jgi:hypothetical protein